MTSYLPRGYDALEIGRQKILFGGKYAFSFDPSFPVDNILRSRNERWNSDQENSMGEGTEATKYKMCLMEFKKPDWPVRTC